MESQLVCLDVTTVLLLMYNIMILQVMILFEHLSKGDILKFLVSLRPRYVVILIGLKHRVVEFSSHI